jgi:hypothetical protein
MYFSTSLFLAILTVLSASLGPMIVGVQDPIKIDPQHFKVLFENETVRILEVRVEGGGKVPLHSHPSGFAYALSDFKAKTTLANGTAIVGDYKAGQFVETMPVTHIEENTGDTLAHLLLIEFKTTAK